jgi:glutathione S-transferase
MINNATFNPIPLLTLGYWPVRGRAEPIRLLLEVAGITNYEQRKYLEVYAWFEGEKRTLQSAFPNLPYLIHGGNTITENDAIAHYVCLMFNREDLWGGKTPADRVEFQMIKGVLKDAKQQYLQIPGSNPDYVNLAKRATEDKVMPLVDKLNAYLGDKPYLLGYLTYADCQLYDLLEWIDALVNYRLDSYTRLREFQKRFRALPQIALYLSSTRFQPTPFIGPHF